MDRRLKRISVFLLMALGVSAQAAESVPSVAYLALAEGFWQAWVMKSDGTEQKRVTDSPYDKSRLSWYPDGKSLLINGNQGELFRVNVDTGEETPVKLPLQGMYDASLSPNGQQIAFSLSPAGTTDGNEIWVINVDGTQPRKLTNMQWLQHDPAWSADGERIFFLSTDDAGGHNVWELGLQDAVRRQVTFGTDQRFDVAVSSSGELVYSQNSEGNYDLWTEKPGKAPGRMTRNPALDGNPAWSPDGEVLIFESTRDGSQQLWKKEVGGGDEAVQLTHHQGGARAPVWLQTPERGRD